LLFVTASRLQWDLQKEKEKNRKPTPQMPLSEVISRIIGSDDQSKPGASTLVGEALPSIREKARLGMISVWQNVSRWAMPYINRSNPYQQIIGLTPKSTF
jgi:hypothetical protein